MMVQCKGELSFSGEPHSCDYHFPTEYIGIPAFYCVDPVGWVSRAGGLRNTLLFTHVWCLVLYDLKYCCAFICDLGWV